MEHSREGEAVITTKPALYPFQEDAVRRMVAAGRWLLNFEMGLGKTPSAVETMRRLHVEKALVVCPALVRTHWLAEFDRWWPGHPEAVSIDAGLGRKLSKKRAAIREQKYQAPIKVVSYGLIDHLPTGPYDAIVFDEIHRLQNPRSQNSKWARALRDANPNAAIYGLTATIMPDKPYNAWQPLDILFPGKWGRAHKNHLYPSYQFSDRYCLRDEGQYGMRFFGVNPDHRQEFADKLRACSSRVTKADVAHLLPAFQVQVMRAAAEQTIEQALTDWLEDAKEGTSHVCILTKHRDVASGYADKYGGVLVTGALPPDQRARVLEEAKAHPNCVLVATMDSVVEGIDLTKFTQVALAELSYSPRIVVQVLGRFSRLSGRVPSTINILVKSGTISEVIAAKLCDKISTINALVKGGTTDTALEQALLPDKACFLSEVRAIASAAVEAGNPYLIDFDDEADE